MNKIRPRQRLVDLMKLNDLPGKEQVESDLTPTMTSEQIRRTRRRLLRWGRRNYQIYPWRLESDSWLTFVAELFLQRTQARQVEKVYRKFKECYPTPPDLLNADDIQVSRLIEPLGLAFRVGFLQEIARVLVKQEDGLPETIDELTRFKGVGIYTAAAWLSLHRGTRAVLIDSNVARWLSRMTGNPYNRDPRHVSWIKNLAEKMTPARVFKDYNYAVLDFTMLICLPCNPVCEKCPFRTDCSYYNSMIA